jgi:hypothetical protein
MAQLDVAHQWAKRMREAPVVSVDGDKSVVRPDNDPRTITIKHITHGITITMLDVNDVLVAEFGQETADYIIKKVIEKHYSEE